MLIPKPLEAEPTLPALSAALWGRTPLLPTPEPATYVQNGVTQHKRWAGAPPGHSHTSLLSSLFPVKAVLTHIKNILGKNTYLYLLKDITPRSLSPHALPSANANPAWPLQNTSKMHRFHFSCGLEFCCAHNCPKNS